MNSAALTRNAVAAMVERYERDTGSRMVAYERVASVIGLSADWVRGYLSPKPRTKEPSFPVGINILTAYYDQLCNRVEQHVERERCEVTKLKGQIDATFQIVGGVAEAQGAKVLAGTAEEAP